MYVRGIRVEGNITITYRGVWGVRFEGNITITIVLQGSRQGQLYKWGFTNQAGIESTFWVVCFGLSSALW